MSRTWMFLVAASAAAWTIAATAEGIDASNAAADSNLIIGSPINASLGGDITSCPTCPKLYNNTCICTVNVQGLPMGGQPSNPMSLLDWFETPGGSITGFDVFFVNAGSAAAQNFEVRFWVGTDEDQLGLSDPNILFRTLNPAPALAGVPAFVDPFTGRPGLVRASIDYTNRRYTLVGLSENPGTGMLVVEPLNGVNGQDLASGVGRDPFTLPPGKVGVQVRLNNEPSICNTDVSHTPKAGVAMAGGGSGNVDGIHIIASYNFAGSTTDPNCQPAEYTRICNAAGWGPFINTGEPCSAIEDCEMTHGTGVFCQPAMSGGPNLCLLPNPCEGGDVCNLDRPFNGIALALYIGAGEAGDGNNDTVTADQITAPAAGSGMMTSVNGFLGDNATLCDCANPECSCTPFPLFDADASTGGSDPVGDGDVDLIDWRDFQRCFNRVGDASCHIHDADGDGMITLTDYRGANGGDPTNYDACFTGPAGSPIFMPNDPEDCSGNAPPGPNQLADVDLYRVTGLTQNHVVSILVHGGGGGSCGGSTWDPFIRVFNASGHQIPFLTAQGGESDDFERFSLDGFTTVKVPAGTNSLYIGVSSADQIMKTPSIPCTTALECQNALMDPNATCGTANPGLCDLPCTMDADCAALPGFPPNATCGHVTAGQCDVRQWYDPTDASTVPELSTGAMAGGYTLSLWATNPNSVTDPGGNINLCYEKKHEPDDTMADATARGAITNTILRGAIGDGAFTPLGQDMDLYRVELDGAPLTSTQNSRSFTAQVMDLAGLGFQSVFDLVLAVYNSNGELIATGDQTAIGGDFDQSRPLLGVNVCGSMAMNCVNNPSPEPGLYYLAVFGTDRQIFDLTSDDCDNLSVGCPPFSVARPPTLLNFPHGIHVAATQCADIRPYVGGRVNKPGARLVGRTPPNPNTLPNRSDLQCYRVNISTSTSALTLTGTDADENVGSNGNDSIPMASMTLGHGDRLSSSPVLLGRSLGNGRYGGRQGDVDFFNIPATPGKIISINLSDNTQPPGNVDNRIRSYLALYDVDGFVFQTEDYSLERYDENINIGDHISDEIASNITGVVPDFTGHGSPVTAVFPMIGIDCGNLNQAENTPFDALFPGTTLCRRFQTDVQQARGYRVSATLLEPVTGTIPQRVFAVLHRGRNAIHTNTFTSCPNQTVKANYPPIVELDPRSGVVKKILNGEANGLFTSHKGADNCMGTLCPGGVLACETEVTANPLVAYDGTTLFVTTEQCVDTQCADFNHLFFKINPNLNPGQNGFVQPFGTIAFNTGEGGTLTGMAEMGGWMWALNTTSNRIRFWNKTSQPNLSNGGISIADPMAMPPTNELLNPDGSQGDGTVFNDLDGDMGTDGTHLYIPCYNNAAPVGICKFTATPMPDGMSATFAFVEKVADPITQPQLTPGPRLGGFDILPGAVMIASDKNGTIIEYWDMGADTVTGLKLPREFLVDRLTAR